MRYRDFRANWLDRRRTYDPGRRPASRYFAIRRRVTTSSSPCGTVGNESWRRDQACSHLQRSAASGHAIECGSVIERTVQPLEELLPARQEVATEHSLPFLERVKIQVVVLALGALGTPQGDDVPRVPFIQRCARRRSRPTAWRPQASGRAETPRACQPACRDPARAPVTRASAAIRPARSLLVYAALHRVDQRQAELAQYLPREIDHVVAIGVARTASAGAAASSESSAAARTAPSYGGLGSERYATRGR